MADVDGLGVVVMAISVEKVAEKYLVAKKLSAGTRKEYRATVTKWMAWGKGVDVDQLERHHLREFLDWVHEKASQDGGSNAGRTANKARENLRAIMSLPQPTAFNALLHGFDGECPCCRRRFGHR
jgi:hypothetical protein